jgi:inward rectifier potassium channel
MKRRNEGARFGDNVEVAGVPMHPLRDLYHLLLRATWPGVILFIFVVFLGINSVFALAYWKAGGIAGAQEGSLLDAFFFSVQTFGTIGYGAMHPTTRLANALVSAESFFGLLATALCTGLVFSRFSQPRSEVVFADNVTISIFDGSPTLTCRIGNDRKDVIVNAEVSIEAVKTTTTKEGHLMYRSFPLKLVRGRASTLSRTWTALHVIDESSPLWNMTPELAKKNELEIYVSVTGIDETTMQTVHGRTRYLDTEVLWGARMADLLSEDASGKLKLDLTRFDDVESTPATETFPFSHL